MWASTKASELIFFIPCVFRYKFPLDSHAWVDWWPLESDCRNAACKQYAGVLDDFEFDFILSGCEDK